MPDVFQQIIDKELPAKIIFENDKVIVLEDIHPRAPIHLLIITKKAIPDLQSMQPEDYPLLQEIVKVAQQLAEEYGISDGYRLVTNNGPSAGQTIFHLHFHLLGGKRLGAEG